MKNGNALAYPMEAGATRHFGLTKRELIAAMALQGLLASGWDHAGVPKEGAETAVAYADHLLTELGRTA